MNNYANTYKYYDQINFFSHDLLFYMKYVRKRMQILEMGCGTGRISSVLAKNCNITIDCVDISNEMISVFNNKIENTKHAKRISIIKEDMKDYFVNKKYDLILFPFQSFQTLYSKDDQKQCLHNCLNMLNSNGTIILTFYNFEKNHTFDERLTYFKFINDGLLIETRKTDSFEENIIEYHIINKFYNKNYYLEDEQIDNFKIYNFRNNEIQPFLTSQGYNVINMYSSYDKNTVHNDSENIIVIAKKNNPTTAST